MTLASPDWSKETIPLKRLAAAEVAGVIKSFRTRLPLRFVTSLFMLGGYSGGSAALEMKG
jgi:hypothetical protein